MPIETTRDSAADLTTHVVTGVVVPAEMYQALNDFYARGPTRLVLWDMTGADVTGVTHEILRPFVERAVELGVQRSGGKTAVLAAGDLAYGFARMSQHFVELGDSPYELGAFRDRDEAMAWLTGDASG